MQRMEKEVLKAVQRSITGKKVGRLRREGKLPAVIYGHHIEATPVLLDLREATKLLSSLTGSSLVTIDLEGKELSALVREKQRDFIRGNLLHVDFQAVSLTEKIRASVSIETKGIAPAVKEFNGVVVSGINEIHVECLPQNLPERFIVDLSELKSIGDGIYLRDLQIPEEVAVLSDPDEMIIIITSSAIEVEEEVEEVAGVEEPEVIERGKKEEEAEE